MAPCLPDGKQLAEAPHLGVSRVEFPGGWSCDFGESCSVGQIATGGRWLFRHTSAPFSSLGDHSVCCPGCGARTCIACQVLKAATAGDSSQAALEAGCALSDSSKSSGSVAPGTLFRAASGLRGPLRQPGGPVFVRVEVLLQCLGPELFPRSDIHIVYVVDPLEAERQDGARPSRHSPECS